MVKVQRLFAKTNLKIRVCAAQRSNESPSGAFKQPNGLALARWRGLAPTSSSLSYSFLAGFGADTPQQEAVPIFAHGTILALINNRKPRTAQLIQLTVLGFLVSVLKDCFMKPLRSETSCFLCDQALKTYWSIRRNASSMRERGDARFIRRWQGPWNILPS